MAMVKCIVQLGDYPTDADKTFYINIDAVIRTGSKRLMSVDHFDKKSHPAYAMLCTPADIVEAQIKFREGAAQFIANELTGCIMKSFNSIDTKMGYKL